MKKTATQTITQTVSRMTTQLGDTCDRMMRATPRQITDLFLTLPGAVSITVPGASAPAVYVQGTRDPAQGRVLLVAHSDTVFMDRFVTLWNKDKDGNKTRSVKLEAVQVDPVWEGYTARSTQKGVGIGADDRAGCATLWLLRKLGHSLLIVPDEEVGCVGSSWVAEHYTPQLVDHCFAIQFDRRGSHDIVTYDCDNPAFDEYLFNNYPGYSKQTGSFSDVAILGPALGIAAANISIGFRNEHTDRETLDLLDFYRTVALTRAMLLKDTLESFVHVEAREWGFGKKWAGNVTSTGNTASENDYYCRECACLFWESELHHFQNAEPCCPDCYGPVEPDWKTDGPDDEEEETGLEMNEMLEDYIRTRYEKADY